MVTEDAYQRGFEIVDKFEQHNNETFGSKIVGNLFLMKQARQRHKNAVEPGKKRRQSCITNFMKCCLRSVVQWKVSLCGIMFFPILINLRELNKCMRMNLSTL